MATTLTTPLHRLVDEDKIITLTPAGVCMRLKGQRTLYGPLSYGKLFTQLARMAADLAREEKAKASTHRRRTRRIKRGLLST